MDGHSIMTLQESEKMTPVLQKLNEQYSLKKLTNSH